MSESKRPLMRHEELFEKFSEAAAAWLKDTPEARGLMLVVDWRIGNNDFPPCITVAEPPVDENRVVSMLKQSLKLHEHLLNLFSQQVDQAGSVLHRAEALIRQSQPQADPGPPNTACANH